MVKQHQLDTKKMQRLKKCHLEICVPSQGPHSHILMMGGGGGVVRDLFRSEILAQSDFFGMLPAVSSFYEH